MTIAHIVHSPKTVVSTKVILLASEPNKDAAAIVAAHYKPSIDRHTQMSHYNEVEEHDNEKHKPDWKENI